MLFETFVALLVIYYAYQWTRKPKDIKGSRVLITGGGSGIGRQMALCFAKEGCEIVIWDIRKELIDDVVSEIKSKGGKASGYVCDVSSRNMVYKIAEVTKKESGDIHILVNNAGVVTGKELLQAPDDAIERTININSLAQFWTVKAFLPDMIKNNRGHIVSIASTMGLIGMCDLVDYCTSKFATVGFMESLRLEIRRKQLSGVKTSILCPHMINTGMFEGAGHRFQFLIPVLEPSYVAEKAVEAVKYEWDVLYMPRMVYLTVALLRILPVFVVDALMDFMGSGSAMRNFKGRGLDWTLKKLPNEEGKK